MMMGLDLCRATIGRIGSKGYLSHWTADMIWPILCYHEWIVEL